jgi:hypothetical protein
MFDREGANVEWIEVDPTVENIAICDLVWKPFNFMKNVSYTPKSWFNSNIGL